MTDLAAPEPSARPLAGRIALVTGATRGIGQATALALAEAGAHIIALGRTSGALEELDDAIVAAGSTATLVPMDIKDFPAIDRLGGALYERFGKLDIFIGNAGVLGPMTPLAQVEPKEWDDALAVNLTANWRLVRSLDPLLRLSTAGRAVLVSSGAAHKARAFWGTYAISKAAVEMLARTWANEVANISNLRVNLINPGPTRTRMRAKAFPSEDPQTLPAPEDIATAILALCLPSFEETGKLYDFPTGSLRAFPVPA
ncbi:NAD(P)-dependent dehydrogenase (short-subunit alcohol dehydrogenase family) [Angulomicrobium tetraedrale]|uniref:NAD(P)-dependent dehydrogenase (Short-subunit alcohol dehydrogenase family) n=1 Tax=Ancylobacter tetraedralis TaxID=217068 RepID=A0A839Z762_9HYPH|nr:SDR family NAD(P)-dependent oxidoreductase [Ancylobacter tetraedralis]MBB3770256.1 NAD(P)-dependent dehydrogenase (short-subunit alcohol dehydrogenase family) [Ancylobacter tetraedralis]